MSIRTTTTSDALEIIRRRYFSDPDPAREARMDFYRSEFEVAQMIYDLREAAGLTQKELAALVGTSQSVVSRLEDADYKGHSLQMLHRIARALGKEVHIRITAGAPQRRPVRVVRAVKRPVHALAA